MELRPIRLPHDLMPLGDMLYHTFQYPENPEWSVQADEKEHIIHTLNSFRTLWPLIRFAQFFSPALRDMFRGYVAIVDGKIVGVTIIQRRGTTDTWVVGTVGVLPGYRRQGIARACLEKSLDLLRHRGATKTWLAVIDGNTPAQRLYESLGFTVYDASINYTLRTPAPPSVPQLPTGYTISRLGRSDWRARFVLEERIAPLEIRKYEPIERGRFKLPMLLRLLIPIINRMQRIEEKEFVIREVKTSSVVARCEYSASTRGRGVNSISVRLDPAHSELADYLTRFMLHKVVSQSPNLRIETDVPQWMPAVATALEAVGFKKRVKYLKMGMML